MTTTGYDPQTPTEATAIAALAAVLTPPVADGLWALAARTLGLQRPVDSPADLRRVAEWLMQTGDVARVTGRSIKVRVITYEALDGKM